MSEFPNENIDLIELNRYIKKTDSELLKEMELLKEEYSKNVKRGAPRKGEVRENKNWTLVNISETLGVGTTKLKKLLSIKKYEPVLLKKVDMGVISTEKAYQLVREKHILPKQEGVSYSHQQFKFQFKRLIKKYKPSMEDVIDVLNGVELKNSGVKTLMV